jgi:hypothetical protein
MPIFVGGKGGGIRETKKKALRTTYLQTEI